MNAAMRSIALVLAKIIGAILIAAAFLQWWFFDYDRPGFFMVGQFRELAGRGRLGWRGMVSDHIGPSQTRVTWPRSARPRAA